MTIRCLSVPATAETGHWQGSLALTFGRTSAGTRLLQTQVQAPLKVQRPFYPEGPDVCHGVILHTAGGVVGGDRLALNLELQPEAHALITTAAANKIYRSNGLVATQAVHIKVAPQACLEWLPQETIAFEHAHYRQQMRVELAPGATWIAWELTRFGRTARGEHFCAGDWRSHSEVWQGDRPLWIDRQWLPGSADTFYSPHGLAGCPVVGSFVMLGHAVEPNLIQAIRATWHGHPSQAGVTRLPSGLLCRYRGHSTMEMRQWFVSAWAIVRSHLLHRPVCLPRVW